MEQPYELSKEHVISRIPVTRETARGITPFIIENAQRQLTTYQGGNTLLSQVINYKPYYLDFMVLNAAALSTEFNTLHKGQLFLFFCFKGEVVFHPEATGEILSKTSPKCFWLGHASGGGYTATCTGDKNKTKVLAIALLPEWIASKFAKYPHLQEAVNRFLAGGETHWQLPHCTINRKVCKYLARLLAVRSMVFAEAGALIEACIAKLLALYDRLVEQRIHEPVYKCRYWLDQHYRQHDLSNTFLAGKFGFSVNALLERFKENFYCTPHHYLTGLRMRYAHEQIIQYGKSPGDIYYEAGYNNERTFMYEYDLFLQQNKDTAT